MAQLQRVSIIIWRMKSDGWQRLAVFFGPGDPNKMPILPVVLCRPQLRRNFLLLGFHRIESFGLSPSLMRTTPILDGLGQVARFLLHLVLRRNLVQIRWIDF